MGRSVMGADILVGLDTPTGHIVPGGQREASFERTNGLTDQSSKDDKGWENSGSGRKGWTVGCNGIQIKGDYAQVLLEEKYENDKPVTVYLDVTSTGQKYQGQAIIESLNVTATDGEVATYEMSLKGQGSYNRIETSAFKAMVDANNVMFSFAEDEDEETVASDFTYNEEGVYAQSTLSVTSDSPSVLDVTTTPGTVTVTPAEDDSLVTLTVEASLGSATETKEYEFFVPGVIV